MAAAILPCAGDTSGPNAVASIPLSTRAITNISACSVSTEKDIPDSRNIVDHVDELPDVVTEDDGTIETKSMTTTSSSSNNISNSNNHDQSFSLLPVIHQQGDNIDVSMFRYFYDTVAIGAETVVEVACAMSTEKNDMSFKSSDIIESIITEKSARCNYDSNSSPKNTLSWQLSNLSANSNDTFPSVKTEDPTQVENAIEELEIETNVSCGEEKAEGFEIEPEKWCGISHAIMWSNNDLIGNTVDIRSEVLNILGNTLSGSSGTMMDMGENMLVRNTSTTDVECTRVDELLMKIDTIGSSLSIEVHDQDRLIEKLVTVKQHLLEINDLLKSAPDDEKAEYFRVILRTAILNAEVETQKAQLELEEVRSERSMQVKNKMSSGNVLEQVWNKLKWNKMGIKLQMKQ